MRLTFALLLPVTLAAQNPGAPRQVPERWVPLDSLAARLAVSEDQRATLAPLHAEIDSLMRQGARIRGEARDAMDAGRDPQRMMVFREQLNQLQRRLDRAFERFQQALTDEQRARLQDVRPPRVAPQRRRP